MSSFQRAGSASDAGGTRPGLHGQTLVSMGLVDLDRLMAGGMPLGSVTLLLEDNCSGQHLNILRYFMAEGVACKQRVLWLTATPPAGGPGAFLPAEATSSQADDDKEGKDGKGSSGTNSEQELRIAWQYRKYIKQEDDGRGDTRQQSRPSSSSTAGSSSSSSGSGGGSSFKRAGAAVAAGVGRMWCRAYDLTRPVGQAALDGAALECMTCSGSGAYAAADAHAGAFVQSLATASAGTAATTRGVAPAGQGTGAGAGAVGRLVIESAGSLAWGSGCGAAGSQRPGAHCGDGGARDAAEGALQRLLFNVRHRVLAAAAAGARCAALVTVPAGLLSPSCVSRLCHAADTVVALEPIADDSPVFKLLPEPQSAVALLSVRKMCSSGMLGPRQPDPQLHVVRNRRRRLAVVPVEVDPDAEERMAAAEAKAAEAAAAGVSGGGGAGGGGGAAAAKAALGKGAAAVLCSGPVGSNKALEF